ncbi:hypothetical protein DW791_16325 [Bacteroides fragilis]|nr:hypothetical protein DW791_16325 [Bacteroides fragilis]
MSQNKKSGEHFYLVYPHFIISFLPASLKHLSSRCITTFFIALNTTNNYLN